MKNPLIVFLLLALFATNATAQSGKKKHLKWETIEEVEKSIRKNPKLVLIDVYTDWCGWCKKMDKTTFSDPEIVKYIKKKFYPVKFNAESKRDIQFKGHTFKYIPNGNRGVNELAVALLNKRLSYPSVVYLDQELDIITVVPGYWKPEEYLNILKFFGEGLYKQKGINIEDYLKNPDKYLKN
ncbi:thioredoxin [Fulvitalea axinellae]|uniref:Thioredoxin n=1 Tax=Fulvitalea axinellae TaxID=1182444 RepID=A0AAU9CLP1_9BACT|nr:thioredoxin [Fulvitalea axinellae]